QCPAPTPPTQLPVYGWSGSPLGASYLAVDTGIAISNYVWPNSGYPMPFVQVHRLTPTGWRQQTAIGIVRKISSIAVNGNAFAVACPVEHEFGSTYLAMIRVFGYDDGWNLTQDFFAPSTDETQFGRGLTLGSASN